MLAQVRRESHAQRSEEVGSSAVIIQSGDLGTIYLVSVNVCTVLFGAPPSCSVDVDKDRAVQ